MDDVCRVAVKAVWGFNCPWGSFDAKWPFSMQRAFFDQKRRPSAKGVISFEGFYETRNVREKSPLQGFYITESFTYFNGLNYGSQNGISLHLPTKWKIVIMYLM